MVFQSDQIETEDEEQKVKNVVKEVQSLTK